MVEGDGEVLSVDKEYLNTLLEQPQEPEKMPVPIVAPEVSEAPEANIVPIVSEVPKSSATPKPTVAPTATPEPTVAPTATPVAHTHTGGTATCIMGAICETCGEEYGGVVEHSYSDIWYTDSSNHWQECIWCGNAKNLSSHTVTEATCSSPSTCTVCGVQFGECADHVEVENYTYDDNYHYKKCVNCSKDLLIESHSMFKVGTEGELEIYRCSTCGYVKQQLPSFLN